MNLTHPTQEPRISSRELADITGKRHDNLLRDIRKMETSWVKINALKFEFIYYTDSLGRQKPEYQLTKMECLYISTKFNDEARARLIKRWHELETKAVYFGAAAGGYQAGGQSSIWPEPERPRLLRLRHNRLTKERLLDLLPDLMAIRDHEIRERLTGKLLGTW